MVIYNNNFDSSLKKVKKQAQKAIKDLHFTDFFVLNKHRKVIEFLLTTSEKPLLEYYLKSLVPEEMKDFVTLSIKNDVEENICHWYFEEEILVLVVSVDWGANKQDFSIEIDSENFEILMLRSDDIDLKVLNYKMLNDHMISFVQRQAEIINISFNHIKIVNEKKASKEVSLDNYL